MQCKKNLSSSEQSHASFPKRLRTIMKEKKLRQQDIADLIGKSRQTVGFYLNDVSDPDSKTLEQLARYFHVSSDWLIGLSDYSNTETSNVTVESVGLSEQASKTLSEYVKSNTDIDKQKLQMINLLLEDDAAQEWGCNLLLNLSRYIFSTSPHKELLHFTDSGIEVSNDPDFSDPTASALDYEYSDALFYQLLINRIMKSIDMVRHDYHHPRTMSEICTNLKNMTKK